MNVLDIIKWLCRHEDGTVVEIDKQKFYQHGAELEPICAPSFPQAGTVTTLTGLGNYINANPDNLLLETAYVLVKNHRQVNLQSKPYGYGQRDLLLSAEVNYQNKYVEGKLMEGYLGEFQALLMSWFSPNADRDYLLKLLSNLIVGESAALEDDGIQQKVAVKTGITTVDMTQVKPVVQLAPFRTFADISQPASPYVFRMQKVQQQPHTVRCRLIDTGDETWKLEAHDSITAYLVKMIGDKIPVIG